MLRNLLTLQQISQKSLSTVPRRGIRNRVPEYQKLFQEDNGIPVYLKGGLMDTLLYRITMTLSIGGTGYLFYTLFMAAMPKKNK